MTDGSFAKPGEVGEYLSGRATLTLTIAQNGIEQFVAPLVIPPGDWDCTLTAGAEFVMSGFNVNLSPPPAGDRDPGNEAFVELDMAPGVLNAWTGMRAFAVTNATPQLISVAVRAQGVQALSFDDNNVSGQVTATIIVAARRVR